MEQQLAVVAVQRRPPRYSIFSLMLIDCFALTVYQLLCLQCFDAVGWAAGGCVCINFAVS